MGLKEEYFNKNEGIRKIFTDSKIEANDNLKSRIMKQILTEKALSRKEAKKETPILRPVCSIFVCMYISLIVVAVISYLIYGNLFIKRTSIILLYFSITSIFSVLAFIIAFDEKRRNKQ